MDFEQTKQSEKQKNNNKSTKMKKCIIRRVLSPMYRPAPEKKKIDLTNSLPGGDTSNSFSPQEISPPQMYTYQPPQTQGMFTFGSVQLEKRGNVVRFRKDGGLFKGGKWESRRLVLVGGSRLRTMFSVVCNGEFPRLGTSGILGIRWVGEGSCSSF